ncbi:hypothetical protein K4F52_006388 [Lecanicillium sp. MT-2017a]|nr:hypothetical protein K4F52_006388 [Lecanicillium sp. MT-2017a]
MARQRRQPTSKQQVESDSKEKGETMRGLPTDSTTSTRQWSTRTQWIFFAIASGACAAFNGAFAKLTTTELTTSLSDKIAGAFGLSEFEKPVEYVVRAMFFVLNLVFNGVMWSLFTTALSRGTSATQVSIMNTSTNFIVTAMLGIAIFSEKLPPLWWLGASLLVVGNVIMGRKNEGEEETAQTEEEEHVLMPQDGTDDATNKASDDEDVAQL